MSSLSLRQRCALGASLGLLCLALALEIYLYAPQWDLEVLRVIVAQRTPPLTYLASFLSSLAQSSTITLLSLLGVLLALRERHFQAAWQMSLPLALAALTSSLLKAYLMRPRPPAWGIAPLVAEPYYSFPSGHATVASAWGLALLILLYRAQWSKRLKIALSLIIVFLIGGVGWSRLYNGVHFPSDLLAGLGLGLLYNCAFLGLSYPNKKASPLSQGERGDYLEDGASNRT